MKTVKLCVNLALSVLLICLLASCGTTQSIGPFSHGVFTTSYAQYLDLAKNAESPDKEAYLLRAAERMVQVGLTQEAKETLAQINPYNLPPNLKNGYALIQAKLALTQNKPEKALSVLSNITEPSSLPLEDKKKYHERLAESYFAKNQYYLSAEQRYKLSHLQDDERAATENNRLLLDTLKKIPAATLSATLIESDADAEFKSWLMLATIHEQAKNAQEKNIQLAEWKSKHPEHPGNTLIDTPVMTSASSPQLSSTKTINSQQKLALILPLEGSLAPAATAIQDGVLAAYHDKNTRETPASIKVYDASKYNVNSLYQTAIDEGATVIIGPLSKQQVAELSPRHGLTVPTITLNYTNRGNDSQLYQFGLAPYDEMIQLTDKAKNDGFQRALILAPNSAWGREQVSQFTSLWREKHGTIADSALIAPGTVEAAIKQILAVKGEKIRRQDIDIIFLAADPELARQIVPMLKFYYADNLPIYATSSVYDGLASNTNNRDIEGVYFFDIPFVLTKDKHQQSINASASQLEGSQQSYPRLYALGLDAYRIAMDFQKLQPFPANGIKAATGTLYLDNNHCLRRELVWARVKHGKARQVH